jgi:hypothetical protein
MPAKTLLGLLLGLLVCGSATAGRDLPIAHLAAVARHGQVFLTWREADTPPGTTFNVYLSKQNILDLDQAVRVGRHVESHSARDWWEDPASFTVGKPAAKPVGFRIESGRPRLDPTGGLFVYTLHKSAPTRLFFAVTSTDAKGREDRRLTPGVNTLSEPVAAAPGPLTPIWQADSPQPAAGAGRGKPLWLNLHAKGGVIGGMEYLLFGDESMGWRGGLPFKFSVRVDRDELVVRPTDRVWINRPHREARDGGTAAIWTFWYGYNSRIDDLNAIPQGVPTNYTECRNLWILDWVRRYYRPDPARAYCSGSSMGGCGTVSFGLRHPEWFAALHAHVPIVSYTYLGRASAHRLEPSCWNGPIGPQVKTNEGLGLLDRMNGVRLVEAAQHDLPPLFLVHGRRDGSIPWENNPPFYHALNAAGQALFVYWDNGDHATCGREAPDDVRAWLQRFRRFRLDESYPAFSNTSSNRNPGDGHADNGDIVGWINRGMDWREIVDTPDRYAITLLANYPGIQYPVTSDVTLRRVQKFTLRPGQRLRVQAGQEAARTLTADAQGRIRVPGLAIPSSTGLRLTIQRAE